MKIKKHRLSPQEAFAMAIKKFSPLKLSKYLKNDGGVAIVDKDKAIQTAQEDQAFFHILNHWYSWDYSTDYLNTTLYFEAEMYEGRDYKGDVVYCGVYDESKHEKVTRRLAATLYPARFPSGYIYTENQMTELIKNIKNS